MLAALYEDNCVSSSILHAKRDVRLQYKQTSAVRRSTDNAMRRTAGETSSAAEAAGPSKIIQPFEDYIRLTKKHFEDAGVLRTMNAKQIHEMLDVHDSTIDRVARNNDHADSMVTGSSDMKRGDLYIRGHRNIQYTNRRHIIENDFLHRYQLHDNRRPCAEMENCEGMHIAERRKLKGVGFILPERLLPDSMEQARNNVERFNSTHPPSLCVLCYRLHVTQAHMKQMSHGREGSRSDVFPINHCYKDFDVKGEYRANAMLPIAPYGTMVDLVLPTVRYSSGDYVYVKEKDGKGWYLEETSAIVVM